MQTKTKMRYQYTVPTMVIQKQNNNNKKQQQSDDIKF